MSKKPTVLLIMDGFGLNDRHEANAVYEANTPNIDKLMEEDRKSTRLNSSHRSQSRMPSSA